MAYFDDESLYEDGLFYDEFEEDIDERNVDQDLIYNDEEDYDYDEYEDFDEDYYEIPLFDDEF